MTTDTIDKLDQIVEHYVKIAESDKLSPADKAAAMRKIEAHVLEHGQANHVVRLYVVQRDYKAALKRKFEADTEAADAYMQAAEGVLRRVLNESGSDSVKTSSGTFFRKTSTSVTVADKDGFWNWLQANPEDRRALLTITANKTAVAEYKEANGGALPEGVAWREWEEIQVRR